MRSYIIIEPKEVMIRMKLSKSDRLIYLSKTFADIIMKLSGSILVFVVVAWLISIGVNSKEMIRKFGLAFIITMGVLIIFIIINYFIDRSLRRKSQLEEKENEEHGNENED